MNKKERSEIVEKLAKRHKYHQKVWWAELQSTLELKTGGTFRESMYPAIDSVADDRAIKSAENLRRRFLRNGIIQTTRERGYYRIIASEMDNQEAA